MQEDQKNITPPQPQNNSQKKKNKTLAIKRMKANYLKQKIQLLISIGSCVFLLFFMVTCFWIGYAVKQQCQNSRRKYGGDCVEALTALLIDKNQNYRQRNSAIWALGQLGDKRALPVLESYFTGSIPPRESLDQSLSQYELAKAINLTSGGFNISAVIWRNNLSL